MRDERVRMSERVKGDLTFVTGKSEILVPYDIKMVIYKHVGSQGGVEVVKPEFLSSGDGFGEHNWTKYHFMRNWIDHMRVEVPRSKFELLFSKSGESSLELERFVEDKGGEITLEEMREFQAQQNISKWKSKVADPQITYIGRGKVSDE